MLLNIAQTQRTIKFITALPIYFRECIRNYPVYMVYAEQFCRQACIALSTYIYKLIAYIGSACYIVGHNTWCVTSYKLEVILNNIFWTSTRLHLMYFNCRSDFLLALNLSECYEMNLLSLYHFENLISYYA